MFSCKRGASIHVYTCIIAVRCRPNGEKAIFVSDCPREKRKTFGLDYEITMPKRQHSKFRAYTRSSGCDMAVFITGPSRNIIAKTAIFVHRVTRSWRPTSEPPYRGVSFQSLRHLLSLQIEKGVCIWHWVKIMINHSS